MRKFSKYLIILALVLAAVLSLGSCRAVMDAVSSAADSVASSAQAEISSAIAEGMSDLTEGLSDIRSAASSVSSAIASATDIVSDEIGGALSSVSEEIASDISGALASASDEIASGISDAVDGVTDGFITVTTADTTAETTTPAETTKAAKQYTFRNKTRYNEHYEKHGAEFGNITKEEYLQLANDLINSTSDRVLHKYSEDGDYMYFDQDTGYFLVLSEDGYIRTFFIPSAGINYWNRQ